MSAGRGLYTPEVLGAAMELTGFQIDEAMPLRGSARSRSCGSTIDVALALGPDGKIVKVGIKPHACAVGQASAAVFARSAAGHDAQSIVKARSLISARLSGDAPQPDWPGLALIEPARAYPARHGAILLAWDAAIDALK